MKRLILLLGIVVLLTGCAAIKQGIEDYKTGVSTPLVNGEMSASAKAAQIAAPIASLPVPFAPAAAGVVGTLATVFFAWQRGSQIRKNGAPTASESTNLPHIVQDLANVVAGAFTIVTSQNQSTTGSVVQRIWKTALAVGISGGAVAAADPSVASFLGAHPVLAATFVGITSGLSGLEKGLSTIPAPATQPTV